MVIFFVMISKYIIIIIHVMTRTTITIMIIFFFFHFGVLKKIANGMM